MGSSDGGGTMYLAYNAWVPTVLFPDLSNPYWNNGSASDWNQVTPMELDSSRLYNGSTLFVFVSKPVPAGYTDEVLLQCQLYNASYHVAFKYSGSQQDVTIKDLILLNPVPPELQMASEDSDAAEANPIFSYTSIMWAFGKLLVGSGIVDATFGQAAPSYAYTLVQTTKLQPLLEEGAQITTQGVISIVQGLFQNITLSLLNTGSFQYVVRTV